MENKITLIRSSQLGTAYPSFHMLSCHFMNVTLPLYTLREHIKTTSKSSNKPKLQHILQFPFNRTSSLEDQLGWGAVFTLIRKRTQFTGLIRSFRKLQKRFPFQERFRPEEKPATSIPGTPCTWHQIRTKKAGSAADVTRGRRCGGRGEGSGGRRRDCAGTESGQTEKTGELDPAAGGGSRSATATQGKSVPRVRGAWPKPSVFWVSRRLFPLPLATLAGLGLLRSDEVGALLPLDRCEIFLPPESEAAQPGLARVHCPQAERDQASRALRDLGRGWGRKLRALVSRTVGTRLTPGWLKIFPTDHPLRSVPPRKSPRRNPALDRKWPFSCWRRELPPESCKNCKCCNDCLNSLPRSRQNVMRFLIEKDKQSEVILGLHVLK